LRELKDVLLPVDYLQRSIWSPESDVTRVEPAVWLDAFLSAKEKN
jgi:hypothetical protein